ncbi:MAG: hypothetical protein ACPGWR_13775 [Ardenticatenaceae bacterium]
MNQKIFPIWTSADRFCAQCSMRPAMTHDWLCSQCYETREIIWKRVTGNNAVGSVYIQKSAHSTRSGTPYRY